MGHLTSVSNGTATTLYTGFDPLGRALNHSQLTAGNTFAFQYSYNFAGSLASITYPSGRVVTTLFDGMGRPNGLNGLLNGSPKSYASGITYYPNGALSQMMYGNQVYRTVTLNTRWQAIAHSETLGNVAAKTIWADALTWVDANGHNSGNLQTAKIYAGAKLSL